MASPPPPMAARFGRGRAGGDSRRSAPGRGRTGRGRGRAGARPRARPTRCRTCGDFSLPAPATGSCRSGNAAAGWEDGLRPYCATGSTCFGVRPQAWNRGRGGRRWRSTQAWGTAAASQTAPLKTQAGQPVSTPPEEVTGRWTKFHPHLGSPWGYCPGVSSQVSIVALKLALI